MFSILVVSRLVRMKNIDTAIKVVQRLSNAKLTIVGEGPDRERLEKIAGERVEFKGRVTPEELERLYSQCDLVLFLPFLEPFGLVPIEAMKHGKPVVCSSEAGVAEIVMKARAGFVVNPRDIEDISRKVSILLSNKKLRQQMGRNGKRYVSKQFFEKCVSQMEDILKKAYLSTKPT